MSKRKRNKILSTLIALAVTGTVMGGANTVYAETIAGGCTCTICTNGNVTDDIIHIGQQTSGTEAGAIVVGNLAKAGNWSIAIGSGNIAENNDNGAQALGAGSIAIGTAATVTEAAERSVAIGEASTVTESYSVALGVGSFTDTAYTVSVGSGNDDDANTYQYRRIVNVADGVDAHDAVTVGQLEAKLANVSGENLYVKVNDNATEPDNVAASATGDNAIAIGNGANSTGYDAIAIGKATVYGDSSIAIGEEAKAYTDSTLDQHSSACAIAIGRQANATDGFAVALGDQAEATEMSAVAIGGYAKASSSSSVAIGSGANVSRTFGTAIGDSTSVTGWRAVAIGHGSVANADDTVSVGYGDASDPATNAAQYRRIVNVADGTGDHDAVTLGQINSIVGATVGYTGAMSLDYNNANYISGETTLVAADKVLDAQIKGNADAIANVNTALDAKANAADVYTKTEVDTALDVKANAADVYTKTDADNTFATKTEVDTALGTKADTSYVDSAIQAITGTTDGSAPTTTMTEINNKVENVTNNTTNITYNQDNNTTIIEGVLNTETITSETITTETITTETIVTTGDASLGNDGLKVDSTTGDVTVKGDITAGGDVIGADANGEQISLVDTEARVDTLEGDVDTLKTDVANLDTRVDTLEQNIGADLTDLEGRVEVVEDKTAGIERTQYAGTTTGEMKVTDDFVVDTNEGNGKVTIGYIGENEMLFTQNEAGDYTFGVNAETGAMQANGGAEFGKREDGSYNVEMNADGVAINSGMSVAGGALTVEENGKTVMSVKDSNGSFTVNEIGGNTMFYGKNAEGEYTVGINAQTGGIESQHINVGNGAFIANNTGAAVNGNLQIGAQKDDSGNAIAGTGNLGVEGGITAGTDVVAQGHSLVETSKLAQANADAIGDRQYTSTNYIAAGDDLTAAASKLDAQVKTNADDIAANKADIQQNADNIAINAADIAANTTAIGENRNAIVGLGQDLGRLGNRVDKVGAGAAALAALHPLDYDAENKLSFSAGIGNYAGQTAGAVGAFYRPNEDVMFSIGGTAGNGENMVNMGVSFALGKGSSGLAKMSKVELVNKVQDMEAKYEAVDAENKELRHELNKLKELVMKLAEQK